MLLWGHLALLVNHKLFGVSAGKTDELETPLAFVDTVKFSILLWVDMSLKGLLQISQWSAS
jgi:hypothetical protein